MKSIEFKSVVLISLMILEVLVTVLAVTNTGLSPDTASGIVVVSFIMFVIDGLLLIAVKNEKL
jgi:hypothetical protein